MATPPIVGCCGKVAEMVTDGGDIGNVAVFVGLSGTSLLDDLDVQGKSGKVPLQILTYTPSKYVSYITHHPPHTNT